MSGALGRVGVGVGAGAGESSQVHLLFVGDGIVCRAAGSDTPRGPTVNRGQDNRHSGTTKTDNPVSPHSSRVAIRHFKGS